MLQSPRMKVNIQTARTGWIRLLERFGVSGDGNEKHGSPEDSDLPIRLNGEWIADDFVRSSSCW